MIMLVEMERRETLTASLPSGELTIEVTWFPYIVPDIHANDVEGIITVPRRLTERQAGELRDWWSKREGGAGDPPTNASNSTTPVR